jgi:beta-lactamase superfamily II metal-dependent hydrolase
MSIVKSLSVGYGDMYYIRHNYDNFTIIDCFLNEENKKYIIKELKDQSSDKNIRRFISTHPDDDHIRGLAYLDDELGLLNFYCAANNVKKTDKNWTEDFDRYCTLRDSEKAYFVYRGCSRKWLNEKSEERRSSGIEFLWPVTSNKDYKEALKLAAEAESPNNISTIITYSINDGPTFIWKGDLESDFQEKVKNVISLPSTDILFAPHHGRATGKVCAEWLAQMSPGIVIIGEAPSEYLDYYSGYKTITQNSAGDIIFDCSDNKVHIYVSSKTYRVNFLKNENRPNDHGAYYLGTYKPKSSK